ncbi:hypothetical protein B566_EDAN004098 [Ephemera danica]|nr:hypothetical protein B566_EDAN004098 [Ephemera danica]
MMEGITYRVQYLNDIDPFEDIHNFPGPPRPPLHTFNKNLPLINQIAAVHRLLAAPHRPDNVLSGQRMDAFFCFSSTFALRGITNAHGGSLRMQVQQDAFNTDLHQVVQQRNAMLNAPSPHRVETAMRTVDWSAREDALEIYVQYHQNKHDRISYLGIRVTHLASKEGTSEGLPLFPVISILITVILSP